MRVDLAGGSGDITRLLLPRVSPNGQVMLADINTDMLALAKKRLGNAAGVRFIHCNAEKLPFVECRFDRVIIAFGLRNIGKRDTALAQMRRVLRIGGKIVILEFSPPSGVLAGVQDFYLRRVLPFLGRQLADDEESYRYLGESILRFPPPPTLKEMLNDAGFEHVRQFQFAAGRRGITQRLAHEIMSDITLSAPLKSLERLIVGAFAEVESWLRSAFTENTAPFYSSVDLRNNGGKIAPIDTNLFPGGFNNLPMHCHPLAANLLSQRMESLCPTMKSVLLILRATPATWLILTMLPH